MPETISSSIMNEQITHAFKLDELKSFCLPNGTSYALVAHNAELQVVSDIWLGDFRDDEQFKEVVSYIMTLLESGNYKYWLADSRFVTHLRIPAEEWLFDEIFPKALTLGLERFALVGPPITAVDSERTAAIEHVKNKYGKFMLDKIRPFTDMAPAKKWLLADSAK